MTQIDKAIEVCDKQTLKLHEMEQTINYLVGRVGDLETENSGLKQVIVMLTDVTDVKEIQC